MKPLQNLSLKQRNHRRVGILAHYNDHPSLRALQRKAWQSFYYGVHQIRSTPNLHNNKKIATTAYAVSQ